MTDSPYQTERKNLQITVLWFFLLVALLGLMVFFAGGAVPLSRQDSNVLPFFLLGVMVLFAAIGALLGIKPVYDSMSNPTSVEGNKTKSRIMVAGGLFEVPGLAGAMGWLFFGTWWLYVIGLAITGIAVFAALLPAVGKLYDLLDFNLQRAKDQGQTVTSKKTTYEL